MVIRQRAHVNETHIDQALARLRREAPTAVAQPNGRYPFWVAPRQPKMGTKQAC